MAAVTVNTKPSENVIGNQRQMLYPSVTFTTGQTLDVPLRKVLSFNADPNSALTAVAYAAITGGTRITLTGSGTASKLEVVGH